MIYSDIFYEGICPKSRCEMTTWENLNGKEKCMVLLPIIIVFSSLLMILCPIAIFFYYLIAKKVVVMSIPLLLMFAVGILLLKTYERAKRLSKQVTEHLKP